MDAFGIENLQDAGVPGREAAPREVDEAGTVKAWLCASTVC